MGHAGYALDHDPGVHIHRVPDEFPTIQAAIDHAIDGDTVLVADGIYTGDGNRDIDYRGKAIVVMSESGPDDTVIDCQATGRGFWFHSGEGPDSRLRGFTIVNGYFYPWQQNGGGILCDSGSSPTITRCIISGNTASSAGGIACHSSSPVIANCTVSGNRAHFEGGGIYLESSSPVIKNCTISKNDTGGPWGDGRGGGIYCALSDPLVVNCTFTGNRAGTDAGGGIYCESSDPLVVNCILWADDPQEVSFSSGSPTITYSDIQGDWPGEGNIDADPLFTDPQHDYTLQAGSPCIDTGDPSYPPPSGGGGRIDMGADEFAYTGDIDFDGFVGLADFASIAARWQETNCGICTRADLNGDGNVLLDDLFILLQNWLAGTVP